ncbi:tyrosine-protein phosphatase [Neobacillus sp. SAB-20_R2A]|uniref:tyrosine-protein phosphatase n=1 Tax=Neobacillus sp. SAB-20_R2A TaxID=3120519 RepID=UPI003C6E0EA8
MIDLHCHILPGIDDGARDLSESIEMARKAASQGIRTIVATPHHLNNQYENPKQIILEKTAELNRQLQQENIDVKIVPGQEVRIHGELLKGYAKDEIQPIHNSNYVLVEFPSNHVPRYANQLFYDMQLEGLIPIIVHPERNQQINEQPDILYRMVEKGALTQVTAASISGDFGKKIKRFTLQLVEANLTHFIASDAHNVKSRTFKLREAFDIIQKNYGNEMVYLLQENAANVLNGYHVYKEVPEKIKKKKLFGIF